MELYGVIANSHDDQTIHFRFDLEEAKKIYDEHESKFNPDSDIGGALVKITGEGCLWPKDEITAQEGVEILETYDQFN